MSEIDSYRNQCIGIVTCPVRFHTGWQSNSERSLDGRELLTLPLYRLDVDALDARSFRAKRGDVLLGGGSGESPALRVAIPEAFYCFTHPEWTEFDSMREIVEAYWTMTAAYVFGDGYSQLGWTPHVQIEHWLAGHILSYLPQVSPADYLPFVGPEPLSQDGSICRKPAPEEQCGWNAGRRSPGG